jgi:DNA-binding NarL/FixJ family response regulator
MYRIGYFDDENREYDNYKVDFKYHNIELVKVSDIETKAQLREYILSEKLDAIIIDYDLSKIHHEEMVDGNYLVRYLNIEIPDFPSIILTSFAEDSRNENTVINALILDRDIMTNDVDGPEYADFIKNIVNLITVFHKRLSLNVDEYQALISKRDNQEELTPIEEQRLINLYKILFAYDLIDEINPMLLTPSLGEKLDKVLDSIKKLTEGQ